MPRKVNPLCVPTKQGVKKVGSRAEVWHGNAHHTSGGLTCAQLKKNKAGKIVGREASRLAAIRFKKNPLMVKKTKAQMAEMRKKAGIGRKTQKSFYSY